MKRKLPKLSKKTRSQQRLPLNNWKIETYSMKDREDLEFIKKEYKLKNPIFLAILVPERDLDTLGLLFFKIQKDLKVYHQGDVDFYANKEDLPKIRKYLTNYYGSYLKNKIHKRFRKIK